MIPHYFLGWPVLSRQSEKLVEKQRSIQLFSDFRQIPDEKDLHVTAVFLGAVKDDLLETIKDNLSSWVPNEGSFEVVLNELGMFGNPDRPRVIYNKVSIDDRLRGHRDRLFKTLSAFGLSLDQRPFTPHITLAKRWNGGDQRFDPNRLKDIGAIEPIHMPVNSLNLYQVNPEKTPRYSIQSSYVYRGERS